jgi:hypothetical protein
MRTIAPLVRRSTEVAISASYPQLGIRSFGKGTFHKPTLSGVDVGSKRLFRIEKGDLLFSNVFAWEGVIVVAKPEDDGRFGSHRFISCVPRQDLATANFLAFYFLTTECLELVRAASPGGAGRNRMIAHLMTVGERIGWLATASQRSHTQTSAIRMTSRVAEEPSNMRKRHLAHHQLGRLIRDRVARSFPNSSA